MGCRGREFPLPLPPAPEKSLPRAAARSAIDGCRSAQSETPQSIPCRTARPAAATQCFPDQRLGQKHVLVLPGKYAARSHAPHAQRAAGFRLRYARRIRTRRRRVHPGSFHIQRFVGTLFVVLPAKDQRPAAARAGWLSRAPPFPVSACDACVRAVRSVPDAPPRCAPAQSPASSTTPPAAKVPPSLVMQTARHYRCGSLPAGRIRETPIRKSPAPAPRWSCALLAAQ